MSQSFSLDDEYDPALEIRPDVRHLHHHDGPVTEAMGARHIDQYREAIFTKIVRAIADHPEGLIGEEACHYAGVKYRPGRPRVTEALQKDFVETREDDGRLMTRHGESGHPAMIHWITELGWAYLEAHERD